MSRVGEIRIDPDKPDSLAKALSRVIQVLNRFIDFGDPLDPRDDTSAVLAGDATANPMHNGRPSNIVGTWVELEVDTPGGAVTCTHNLNVPVLNNGVNDEPNVRWVVENYRHDGNTVDAASALSCNFQDADTVTENAIDLRFYVGGTRVVDATHPLHVSLFFIPVTRWQD